MAMKMNQQIQTTFVLSNLHCPSCVSQIQRGISGLGLKASALSCSIVDQTVTITHPHSLTASRISSVLENAGFDVYDEDEHSQTKTNHAFKQATLGWLNLSSTVDDKKRSRHVESCEYCQTKIRTREFSLESHQSSIVREEKSSLIDDKTSVFTPTDDHDANAFSVAVGHDDADLDLFSATVAISGMTCSSCSSSITRALEETPWVQAADVNLLSQSATVRFVDPSNQSKIVDIIEDAGFDASIEEVISTGNTKAADKKTWRATYAVEGMTCSSCVAAITNALSQSRRVREVNVNLIDHSASVVVDSKSDTQVFTEIVEDIGFAAELIKLEPLQPRENSELAWKTVTIRIDGMFCPQCPSRVQNALSRVNDVEIKQYLTIEDPRISIAYRPIPPEFTIRTVLNIITSLDPGFEASISLPTSLEDRQRRMKAQQQRRILYRVVLSLLIAIPTFMIGIVYMMLVAPDNKNRMYLMSKVGGLQRGDWAMFVLATIVYFFAADVFHRRTLKELYALWRPGSRTPYLRRFYRFGSMNMLVSLGTSIAYWSSVAEMAISASRRGLDMPGMRSTPYYFDSVVFLTLFLLLGRLIEGYSKSKTGDAVSALANLRPKTAMLVTPSDEEKDASSDAVVEVSTDLIEIGDVVRVLHGASPPFDGILRSGTSKFDESSLTGESKLVNKEEGAQVFTGTINKGDAVSITVTGGLGSSMLDNIMNVVREGQTKRAPVERIADLLTGVFVPIITLLAILTWLIWLALGLSGALPQNYLDIDVGGWPFWSLQFAIAVFVVACPCGLGLAAPTALFVGGGLAAKKGILVRGGGEAFQEASGLDIVAFDKTGTLTQGGQPKVADFAYVESGNASVSSATALAIVREVEADSSHPIAKALVGYAEASNGINVERNSLTTQEIPGRGMTGSLKVNQNIVEAIIGNEALMKDFSVPIPPAQSNILDSWKSQGKSMALLAVKQINPPTAADKDSTTEHPTNSSTSTPDAPPYKLTALFSISDPLRPEAASVIAALHKRNISVWMISGDNEATANSIGAQLSIPSEHIIAGVLPAAKADTIKYLQRSQTKKKKRTSIFSRLAAGWHRLLHHLRLRPSIPENNTSKPHRAKIAYIGDGINDAPALTASDVSIAIGSGSDVALASASFILLHSDLRSLLTLLDLSRTVFRRVMFNFAWAGMYNICLVPVAAGCFYGIGSTSSRPDGGGSMSGGGRDGEMMMGGGVYKGVRLDPAWAALAMAGSSVSVVVSSLAMKWSWVPGVGFRDRSGGV